MAYHLLHTLSAPGMPFQRVVVKVLGEPTAVSAAAAAAEASSEHGGDAQALQRKDKVGRAKGFSRVLVGFVCMTGLGVDVWVVWWLLGFCGPLLGALLTLAAAG